MLLKNLHLFMCQFARTLYFFSKNNVYIFIFLKDIYKDIRSLIYITVRVI